jgi:hypothetical protein
MVVVTICLGLSWIAPGRAQAAQVVPGAGMETDRWLEIDMYWFNQKDIPGSVRAFWDRFQPIYAGVRGYRGVILNIGWTVGPVMEWSGNLEQRISLPKGTGQARWVDESEPLRGTTEERMQQAKARFAKPVLAERRGYAPWTYGDVKLLSAALKQEAARRKIEGFKVGMLNYAWTNAYGEEAPWVGRHPEAFTPIASLGGNNFSVGRYFDPGAALHADPAPLGGFPQGIPEGTEAHQAYAAQWGSLSRSLGLDAVMLRDSFGFPVPYQRGGPWGPLASSPEVIRAATESVAALVRETKLANPEALVMMYSSGACAIADWRSNGLDLESIAAEGYLDIFVDQTWAGAWNEVGLREKPFWNAPTKGWTYQLAYTLIHAAVLANSKVRHYPLIETFDAWEDWDVIHSAPDRLRWGIWAYSHAAVKTPNGLKLPVGSYISWANQGERLLSEKDVRFLTENINAAVADAHQTTEVLGPTLVYSRDAMQWQADHAAPGRDVNEWLDEQAGSLAKWPIPILSITRAEWLPQVQSDLFIVGTPSHLAPKDQAALVRLIQGGQPVALFGSPQGGIDPELARLAGLNAPADALRAELRTCDATNPSRGLVANVPSVFQTLCHPGATPAASARVVYSEGQSPALTLNTSGAFRLALWNPPDLRSLEGVPLKEIWKNTGEPYALAAGAMNELLKESGSLHAERIDLRQTMGIASWRSGNGKRYILAGNLEEGLRDDADMTRHATLALPAAWGAADWRDGWTGHVVHARKNQLTIDLPQAGSVLLELSK